MVQITYFFPSSYSALLRVGNLDLGIFRSALFVFVVSGLVKFTVLVEDGTLNVIIVYFEVTS